MYIDSIQLKNYRNYEFLELNFDQGTNILYGDNAQGKTNILEAVCLASTSKSHRGSKDKDMIRFHEEESHIRLLIEKKDVPYKIDMHLKKNKPKGVAINGMPIKKAKELIGIVHVVLFSPEDLSIIKNGPAERRRFTDMELCQLDQLYVSDLSAYNHIVNQRNALLREIRFNDTLYSTLDVWDEQMSAYGERIIRKRREFIEELQEIACDIHKNLTGGLEELRLFYEPDVTEEMLKSALFENRDRDLRLKTSSTGPHRDDICVMVDGIDIRKYGSQGQQRTAALSLKLSEIYLVRQRIHDEPVLLLDDVLSELDSGRQNYLLNSIHDIQTIITCTGLDDFIDHQFKINKVFHVVKGTVRGL